MENQKKIKKKVFAIAIIFETQKMTVIFLHWVSKMTIFWVHKNGNGDLSHTQNGNLLGIQK